VESGSGDSDNIPFDHQLTPDRSRVFQRPVGGSKARVVGDDQPTHPADRTEEADSSIVDRDHDLAAAGAELDPEVPAPAVGMSGRTELIDDRGIDGYPPGTVVAGHIRSGGGGPEGQRGAGEQTDHGEKHLLAFPIAGTAARGGRSRLEGKGQSLPDQADSRSMELRRDLSCKTALVWIWHTRLSVTPSTPPISAKVMFS